MMDAQEIFDQLSSGELSQTELATITEGKYPRLINQVNLGLADLFKLGGVLAGRLAMRSSSRMAPHGFGSRQAARLCYQKTHQPSNFQRGRQRRHRLPGEATRTPASIFHLRTISA